MVLAWSGTRATCLTGPNDEAISGHRPYSSGLSEVPWVGRVRDSRTILELETQDRVHPAHDPSRFRVLSHHVVLLKERVVEVVAQSLSIQRAGGSTLDAAVAVMGR